AVQPLKVDEFSYHPDVSFYPYKEISLTYRIGRFKEALRRYPAATPYIVVYKSRITEEADRYRIENWAEAPRFELRKLPRFGEEESISEVFGGYREENMLEFWIVPKGAPPTPLSPTVPLAEVVNCPSINVYTERVYLDRSAPVIFNVSVKPEVTTGYRWTVTDGKIVMGQDESSV